MQPAKSNRLKQLLGQSKDRRAPIVAVTAGSGVTVKAAITADADMLLAINSSTYRSMGWGSLTALMPFGDANAQSRALINEHILPHNSSRIPIVAGIFGDTPEALEKVFAELHALGVEGVTNWPALGQIDGSFRAALDADGYTAGWEIETLRLARKAGFVTIGFVFNEDDAREFAASGVDALILGLGLTRRYEIIQERHGRIQQEITRLNSMIAAVKKSGKSPTCLASGGSITMAEEFEQILRFCDVDGFAGGSAFESIPVYDIVGSMIRRFKSVSFSHDAGAAGLDQIIGRSPSMKHLFGRLKRVAPHDVNVCIEGESGTGKEMVAAQLHRMSKRSHQAFVTLNCGAIPDTLLESELFGHEKGAFTGAERRRIGKFEQAHRGTLFLDEIANLSPHGQVALLRAIQQREIARVGAETYIPVDVRVLAASNQPLPLLVQQGKFRSDLYHRLSQFTLSLPPLRERRDDISLLVDDMLPRLQVQLDKKLVGISPGFLRKLKEHTWPGNVRELQHVILGAALCEEGPVLYGTEFTPKKAPVLVRSNKAGEWNDAFIDSVRQAMHEAGGNKSRAAEALGVTRKTLYAWLREVEKEHD